MPLDTGRFDEDLFDADGNPLYPNRIYLPSIVEPCSRSIILPSLPDDTALGAIELRRCIYLSSIGSTERFGKLSLVLAITLPSLADDTALGSISMNPAEIPIKLPTIREECP